MTSSKQIIEMTEKYGAHNYHPLDVVISEAEGVWVKDPEGKKYMDMLSAYSAINHGHRHPEIVAALKDQLDKVAVTSRAFHNDQFGPFLKELCELTGMDMALPMNSGAEAVETAIKAARKWGYEVKKVPHYEGEIIVCANNFHGRTVTLISFSTEPLYKDAFGPFTPGFRIVPFGDAAALEKAFNKNTIAFLAEPIQGEAGVVVPPEGYLKKARELCDKHNALLVLDEIQTGFGRTGRMFAHQYEGIKPDMMTLGKALGGGVLPVSAVVGSKATLGLFTPGEHGSTFGGTPLACAVARKAMEVLVRDNLTQRAFELGNYFMERLRALKSPVVDHIRGKGLLIGAVLKSTTKGARPYCERLMNEGLLCKETHDYVIRFAPPLVITKDEIDWALTKIEKVLK
jgi:ornithine--oxo-acid transaminase